MFGLLAVVSTIIEKLIGPQVSLMVETSGKVLEQANATKSGPATHHYPTEKQYVYQHCACVMCVCMCVCLYIYIYIYIYVYIYIYTYTYPK